MPFSNFEARARANMEIVLDAICETLPDGQKHDVRAAVANGIRECAEDGQTGINAMTTAGKAALKQCAGSH
ncbi:MAG: hypothetical protein JWQ51_1837 [Tardiphaga sp.]|jgi:hypothetical protein|nr:hypothetical protein [Tardiphaga sp.]